MKQGGAYAPPFEYVRFSEVTMTKIKICGITCLQDIEYINEFKPDFAGFVMFYDKSKRNIQLDAAKELLKKLDKSVKSVAVTVSPTLKQIETAKDCGFDYVQIHGREEGSILQNSPLPVLRAFNVSNMDSLSDYEKIDNIKAYLFDSQTPGSGKTFDWSLINNFKYAQKPFILAGGLNPDNVSNAIMQTHPFGVDVSSGVENDNGVGKNREKIAQFINNVRNTAAK